MAVGPENGIELFATLQRELMGTGDSRDAERAGIIGVMLGARGKGLIYHPQTDATSSLGGAPVTITAEHTLELAAAAYKARSDNPELLTDFNQAFWAAKRQAMGLAQSDLVVSPTPYTPDQIRKFMRLAVPDFALCVPQIVSTTPEGLILLGKGWPEMGSLAFQEGTTIKNENGDGNRFELYSWMRTEQAVDAPYLRTNQAQAERKIREGRVGDTLNIYAIAGQQSKLLTGKYLDQDRTWVRVLSSRSQGWVLYAYFGPHGYCYVYWDLGPDSVDGFLGARSVEVAKT